MALANLHPKDPRPAAPTPPAAQAPMALVRRTGS
jgi:hypothetical protein